MIFKKEYLKSFAETSLLKIKILNKTFLTKLYIKSYLLQSNIITK